jgi:hypothetical protein
MAGITRTTNDRAFSSQNFKNLAIAKECPGDLLVLARLAFRLILYPRCDISSHIIVLHVQDVPRGRRRYWREKLAPSMSASCQGVAHSLGQKTKRLE